MLGHELAALERTPLRRFIRRAFGSLHVGTRLLYHQTAKPLAALRLETARDVLDAGCGSGVWTLHLARRYPGVRFVGIDINGQRLAQARAAAERLDLHNLSFRELDFREMSEAGAYDAAVSVNAIHYYGREDVGVFGNLARALRPEGRFLFVGPVHSTQRLSYLRRFRHDRGYEGYTLEGIEEKLTGAGFDVQSATKAVGKLGSLAKELAWLGDPSRLWRGLLLPPVLLLELAECCLGPRGSGNYVVVLAQRPPEPETSAGGR